ncbi:hypothetical protein FACS1894109_19760 [Spirochaetia bacterium]|nr:hypothetical protein FACS1894109_19760 [Spirochaetia bacterium]
MSEMDVDVLVVGAFTAGLYFGGLMAKQGYKVLICDALPCLMIRENSPGRFSGRMRVNCG